MATSAFPDADAAERAAVEAFSRAEIPRTEVERRLGREIGFGDMLLLLGAHNLPLPHYPSDLNSPGAVLMRQLLERAAKKDHGSG